MIGTAKWLNGCVMRRVLTLGTYTRARVTTVMLITAPVQRRSARNIVACVRASKRSLRFKGDRARVFRHIKTYKYAAIKRRGRWPLETRARACCVASARMCALPAARHVDLFALGIHALRLPRRRTRVDALQSTQKSKCERPAAVAPVAAVAAVAMRTQRTHTHTRR